MSEATELDACPFCSGKPLLGEIRHGDKALQGFIVECSDCTANVDRQPSEEEAIAAWNRRASLAEGKTEPAPPTLLQFVSNEEMTEILRELAQAASKGLGPDLDAMQCAVLTNLIRHYVRRYPLLVGEQP